MKFKAVWYDAVYIGVIFTDDLQALAAASDVSSSKRYIKIVIK
jgi:hypothetical protein